MAANSAGDPFAKGRLDAVRRVSHGIAPPILPSGRRVSQEMSGRHGSLTRAAHSSVSVRSSAPVNGRPLPPPRPAGLWADVRKVRLTPAAAGAISANVHMWCTVGASSRSCGRGEGDQSCHRLGTDAMTHPPTVARGFQTTLRCACCGCGQATAQATADAFVHGRKGILQPTSHLKTCWDWFVILLVVYSAVVVPLEIAFIVGLPRLDIFVDIIFWLDLAVQLNTAFVDYWGLMISGRRCVVSRGPVRCSQRQARTVELERLRDCYSGRFCFATRVARCSSTSWPCSPSTFL